MTRMLRLLGVSTVLVTSVITALSARTRGAIFWASIVISIAAAIAAWRLPLRDYLKRAEGETGQ